MKRLSLYLTLGVVAIGVLVLARLIGVSDSIASSGLTVPIDASSPAVVEGPLVHTEARSGRIDYRLLDFRLTTMMADPQMVGLAVAVVEDGEVTFAKGYGETLAGSRDPVTVDTVFRWASLSKGIASTLLAMLEEDGEIDLDAPVTHYQHSLRLPNGGERQARVVDLLSHRLGLTRNAFDGKLEDGEDPRALRGDLATVDSPCPPGDCFNYQNIAYDAASEMVSAVSDMSYETAAQRMLFTPLGMDSASLTRRGLMASESWARSHDRERNEVEVVEPYYRIPAAGGMNGSIRDLARWMQVQMGEAPGIVSPAVLRRIHAPVVRTDREDRRNRRYSERIEDTWYGLGWRIYRYAGHELIVHRGAVRGYRAAIMFDPRLRTGIVVLSNSDSGRPFAIPMDLFDDLYGLPDEHWIENSAPEELRQKMAEAASEPVDAPAEEPMIEGRRRPDR
ncbi:MAG: serine hydrolase domain-containing protein [Parasphingopyxis sp.]|uniref:serine hydrolase domain-containing protein n=1 Tax=Parasphingopyxis sp. TaxID=1920299 RepID=UPI0032EF43C9